MPDPVLRPQSLPIRELTLSRSICCTAARTPETLPKGVPQNSLRKREEQPAGVHTPVTPALGRLGQEGRCELQASLGHTGSSCLKQLNVKSSNSDRLSVFEVGARVTRCLRCNKHALCGGPALCTCQDHLLSPAGTSQRPTQLGAHIPMPAVRQTL